MVAKSLAFHLHSRIIDLALLTRLDPKKPSWLDTRLKGILHVKGSGEEKAVESCEGGRNGGRHREVPHHRACIERNLAYDKGS